MHFLRETLNKKLVATFAVAALLGQFALVLHDVVAEHEPGSACEICIVKDRTTDFLSSDFAVPVVVSTAVARGLHSAAVPAFRRIQAAHPRGPPAI